MNYKSILISIRPEHCCKILNKEKLLEIRKSMPKCGLPCKVYIYCTRAKTINKKLVRYKSPVNNKYKFTIGYYGDRFDGRIVAEFTLKIIDKITDLNNFMNRDYICQNAKLTEKELWDYSSGGSKTMYGWHIDNLIVYDKPKLLNEFIKPANCNNKDFETFDNNKTYYWKYLQKAPQSWCYAEKMEVV